MIKSEITIANKLYGPTTFKGYKTNADSPFVVFKLGKIWTIGHERSQMMVGSLAPHDLHRTRESLLNLVGNIELAKADEVKIVATVTGEGFTPAQSEALRSIRRFALS